MRPRGGASFIGLGLDNKWTEWTRMDDMDRMDSSHQPVSRQEGVTQNCR